MGLYQTTFNRLVAAKEVLLTHAVGQDKHRLEAFLQETINQVSGLMINESMTPEQYRTVIADFNVLLNRVEDGYLKDRNYEGQGGEEVGFFYQLMAQFVVSVRAFLNIITVTLGFERDRNTLAETQGRMFFFQAPVAPTEQEKVHAAVFDAQEVMENLEANLQANVNAFTV